MDSAELPIFALRARFEDAIARTPVVISSPTGSGKSTEVPRWCEGRVLVVEPRRIACRSLAARVAALEGSPLGERVGYIVRDERVARSDTRIVFATPGIVLRDRALLDSAHTLVLDEFHERGLEVDLLLALLLRQRKHRLVVMSATLDGERVAAHVSGVHLAAEGRAFPVAIQYVDSGAVLPDTDELPARVKRALGAARVDPGDVLVFLPGKAEIEACAQALRSEPYTLVPLHGGLSLDEQRRAFEPSVRRKVILATNVAETSLTIPGIGVVVDSGLVRQTRYHDGRGFLALVPIAEDSAAQRTGRAGRTAPGVCYRLWSRAARLEPTTLPEIHRESLVPLVLAAAAWNERVEDLPLLDAPKPYALEAARADLAAWGALGDGAGLSASGRELFALPITAAHGRLLVAAREEGCLDDAIDLVAALSVGRPLLVARALGDEHTDLRTQGCDATALIQALRAERPQEPFVSLAVHKEALLARTRLRRLEGLSGALPTPLRVDREALLRAAMRADLRTVHIARRRGRGLYFSNGGTELELARESAVQQLKEVDALVVLDTRAFGTGRDARVLVTCGMAVPLRALAKAGLGVDRLCAVHLERKRVTTKIERVYAGRVIDEREETPSGELAREAIAQLLTRGSLFKEQMKETRERLARTALLENLAARGRPASSPREPALTIEAWVRARVQALGIETADDLALLSAGDFAVPDVPYEQRASLDHDYPLTVSVGDASYRAEYDLEKNEVLLRMVRGTRQDAPPLSYLPKFPGLRICVEGPRGIAVVRPRG